MNNAIAKIPLKQVQDVKTLLHNDQARQQLAAVAAKHMSPERLMRVTANAIRTTPKLQQADPLSFLGALMQCASLGLEPNTIQGHAYLVPFDNKRKKITEVQLIVGYKGLIDLARRSGNITSISAGIHYSDDELWEHEEGTEARLRHRPGQQQGEKMHAYAIAKLRDGGHAYVVLPWTRVMHIRDTYSQGYRTAIRYGKKDTPWITEEDSMAMKTAVRALAKFLPMSVELSDALTVDADEGARIDYAAYAMSPEDGPRVEEDGGEEIEGEATEVEEEGEEAKPEGKAEDQKEPEKERAPKDEKAKADPKDQKLFDDIENELADGAPAGAILKFHEAGLAEMEKRNPDLHRETLEMIEKADEA